ncbi:MAG TPA: acetyltransferase [Pirellulales bacterium]|jgi:acetyltransferase EpsM|nr:acetyltransferase [Pirellulales bacterium]
MQWVIFGAGAQGRVVLEILRAGPPAERYWLVDDTVELHGTEVGGVPVVGRDELGPLAGRDDVRAIVAIGHNPNRLKIARQLSALKLKFGNAIHPSAVVSPSASLGEGIVICPQTVVWAGAKLGDHVIVNSGSVVEHDCVLDDVSALGPGVHLAGRVRIGRLSFVGAGATINPRIMIGPESIVGSGSVVTKSVGPDLVAYGVPAREIRLVDAAHDWNRLL